MYDNQSTVIQYSLGFAFVNDSVLLIHKTHPGFQKNKFNGLGGKVENKDNLNPLNSMVREFKEESGISTSNNQWKFYGSIEFTKLNKVSVFYTDLNQSQIDALNKKLTISKDENTEYIQLFSKMEFEDLFEQDLLVSDVYEIVSTINSTLRK